MKLNHCFAIGDRQRQFGNLSSLLAADLFPPEDPR